MAKLKKKIRRGKRRKCNKFDNNDDNKWILYHLNIRGFKSKQKSLGAILGNLDYPNLVILNETCLKNRQKIQLSNYKSFNRNRCTGQIMGGISTSVRDNEKMFVTKTVDGLEKDEFMITRYSNFHNPVNVINIYGEQESRTKDSILKTDGQESMTKLLRLIIEMKPVLLLVISTER